MKTKEVPSFIIDSIRACESGKYTQIQVATVQLIQAAPALLDALKEAEPYLDGLVLRAAQNAIARAEGMTDQDEADEAALRG